MIRERLEYIVLLIFIKASKILPNIIMLSLLKFISKFLFIILKSRRKIAISNLKLAYPNLSYDEIYDIAKQNYEQIALTVYEILLLYNDKKKLDDFIENADEAVKEVKRLSCNKTRPILFTTAHFGNWEILAHYFGYIGFDIVVIGREGNNMLIEKNITTPFRKKFGNDLAHKENAMSKMINFLKSGKNVGILIDQKASGVNSLKTTFFKRECGTSKTIGILKLKFNPVIVPIFALRQNNGKYKFIVREFEPELSGDKQADIRNITQGINDIFEEIVRLDPTQWFWMHNRWKMD